MAALDYVDLPPCATRLRGSSTSTTSPQIKPAASSDLRLAPKVFTSLPNPSPPIPTSHGRQSSLSFSTGSLTSPTMSFIPQLLLSSAIPGGIPSSPPEETAPQTPTSALSSSNPRQSLYPEKYTLLSTKDPLSLPIMSNNFRRFVAKVGPVFWVQDRVEEILLWKKGWRVTGTWMAVYAFLCFYPRMVLMLPHAILIGIMLATYPYPAAAKNGAAASATNEAPTQQPSEGSVPWQANIQAIQNLMGAYSDAVSAVEPHVHHLVLSPVHFRDPDSQTPPLTRPVSPYTPHLLALLAVSFPVLAFTISLPNFPIRQVFLFGGLLPFIMTHPWILCMLPYLVAAEPKMLDKLQLLQKRLRAYAPFRRLIKDETMPLPPIPTVIQRLIDDDRLTDKCWNSEMREVELWENERLGGESLSPQHGLDGLPTNVHIGNGTTGWSKANLRPGERGPWTRGRDGWNGIGAGRIGGGLDVQGEVSSNLTFSLAPGWSFVETEDWRRDKMGAWSGVGADEDGWVYTNDAWLGPRPAPYTAGGGSVTRRRRWTRRVWYDKERAFRVAMTPPVVGLAARRDVYIAQANYTVVHGSYHNHAVTNIDGATLGSDDSKANPNQPRQAGRAQFREAPYDEPHFTFEPLTTSQHQHDEHRPQSRQAVPSPASSAAPVQGGLLCAPPRICKRKRTVGGSPQPGEEPPRPNPPFSNDTHIGHLEQTIHIHQPPRSNTPAWDRLLEHVVAEAAHDSAERHDAPKCHPRTRKAARGEVIGWVSGGGGDEEEEKVLWIAGPAGTGKTAIAGSVADKCDDSGSLAGAFFFSATSETPARRSKRGLITTLAYQLIRHDKIVGLKDEVLAAIDEDPKIFEKTLACQLESLILGPLRRIQGRSDPSTWPNSIIIDGVDECAADPEKGSTRAPALPCLGNAPPNRPTHSSPSSESNDGVYEDIISTLLKAVDDPAFPFRVVVVSRPEPAIRDAFSKAAPRTVHRLFLDEKYNADADIARFLKDKFAKLRVRFKLPKSWPAEPALAKLVRSASGQFVYVSTVMRFIESQSAHPQEQLDLILAWDGHQQGRCPLSQLDELYTKILNTSPNPVLAVTWLHAILELHSENNDSLAMVRGFLETRPGETEFLLQSLASLVSFNDEGTAFRFFHKSLMDFLASPKRCGNLYVPPEAVAKFLQGRWYAILKNRGPQIPMEYADRLFFFRHYVEAFSMRYFYLPGDGTNYTRDDVVWWSDICFDMLGKRYHPERVKNVCDIVHESCPWFLCDADCRMWRSNLRTPTFHQMLSIKRA